MQYTSQDLDKLAADAAEKIVAGRTALRYDDSTLRWTLDVSSSAHPLLLVSFRIHELIGGYHYEYTTVSL